MTTDVVLCESLPTACGRQLGVLTLNSERSLNALTLDMVAALQQQLDVWASDPAIVAVLLRGAGERAFCAGGDVRRLTEVARTGTGDPAYAGEFFAREYRLDYTIHRYAKPLLVWGSGIVMGGGMGLFAGASCRVVTDTTRMAMPEITIGLFPDVGGSYFLSRLPGRLGLFLGLSACHFQAADALWLGLATHGVAASSWPQLMAQLQQADWSQDAQAVLEAQLASLPPVAMAEGPLQQHQARIEALCAGDSLAEIDARWRAELPAEPWLAKAVQAYRAGSPTSAALIWRQWQEARTQSLATVFRTEWMIATACAARADFAEGVRALLIDKDGLPNWQPATLADVSSDRLAVYYQLPAGLARHPLANLDATN